MTTTTFSAAPIGNSDASFRAWGSAVSSAFSTVGMVKTADTGQINWSTVTVPVSGNTFQGYEIWRFNDSLQATVPLFFKVEYGAGQSALAPGWRITIGKGSDGAGAITGTLLPALQSGAPGSSGSASTWYVSSGDGSMLAIAPAQGYFTGSGSSWGFVMERSRSSSGVATSAGIMFCHVAYLVSSPASRTINYAGGATNAMSASGTGLPVMLPGTGSLAVGGNIPLFSAVVADGVGGNWQPRSVLFGTTTDLGAMSAITVDGYGTYMPVTGWFGWANDGATTSRAAMWWQ